jgi:hypothetical protein
LKPVRCPRAKDSGTDYGHVISGFCFVAIGCASRCSNEFEIAIADIDGQGCMVIFSFYFGWDNCESWLRHDTPFARVIKIRPELRKHVSQTAK